MEARDFQQQQISEKQKQQNFIMQIREQDQDNAKKEREMLQYLTRQEVKQKKMD